MEKIVYSDKIQNPNSIAVKECDLYLICHRIGHRWFLVESAWSIGRAIVVKELFNKHERDNGRIPTYEVFDRKMCLIKDKLEGE